MRATAPALLVVLCLFTFATPSPLSAQQSPPASPPQSPTPQPPVRDAQAVALVQRSLAALGGGVASTLQDSQIQGTLAPIASSNISGGTFTWTDDFSGPTFEFRYQLQTADAVRVEVSGHGSPAVEQGTTVTSLRSHITFTALPYHLPAVLLSRMLANTSYSIQIGTAVTVEGGPTQQVIIKSDAGPLEKALSEQRWDFDASTGLPVRIEYHLPNPYYSDQWVQGAVELSKYQIVNGVAVPFQLTFFEDGKPAGVATVSSAVFNVEAPSTTFDLTQTAGGAQ